MAVEAGPSTAPQGSPLDGAPQLYEPVADGQADIATTTNGLKMKVGLDGRQPMQKAYLWIGAVEGGMGKKKTSSTTTNKYYDPKVDGPGAENMGMPSVMPTALELVPAANAVQYLEVGIIHGEYPSWPKDAVRGREKGKGKKKAATLAAPTPDRDPKAMRVYIPITPSLATQAQYSVACRPDGGRCFPRRIDGDCVYFYDEYYRLIEDGLNRKETREAINAVTKHCAAINKTVVDRSTATVTFTEAEKRASSNPLAVTQAESLASLLVLQFSMFRETNNRDHLQAMLQALEDASPDLRNSPNHGQDGLMAFYDFDAELQDSEVETLKKELKAIVPDLPDLEVVQVQKVHQVLRREKWGDRLPYSNLACFLELCHDGVQVGYADDVVKQEVERALRVVRIANRHQHVGLIDLEEASFGPQNYRTVLRSVLGYVQSVRTYIDDINNQLAKQHGGVLRTDGIKGVMNRLGNAVDIATMQTHWNQLAILHAIQHAAGNRQAADMLTQLQKLVEELLRAAQPADGEGGEEGDAMDTAS